MPGKKPPPKIPDPIAFIDDALAETYIYERDADKSVNGSYVLPAWKAAHDKGWEKIVAVRHKTAINRQRKCAKPGCTQPALRTSRYCRYHGTGKERVEARKAKRARNKPKGSRAAFARRSISKLLSAGHIPMELQRHPAFQATWGRARAATGKEIIEGDPKSTLTTTQICYLLAVELVRAYIVREQTGDWDSWSRAVGKIKKAGLLD